MAENSILFDELLLNFDNCHLFYMDNFVKYSECVPGNYGKFSIDGQTLFFRNERIAELTSQVIYETELTYLKTIAIPTSSIEFTLNNQKFFVHKETCSLHKGDEFSKRLNFLPREFNQITLKDNFLVFKDSRVHFTCYNGTLTKYIAKNEDTIQLNPVNTVRVKYGAFERLKFQVDDIQVLFSLKDCRRKFLKNGVVNEIKSPKFTVSENDIYLPSIGSHAFLCHKTGSILHVSDMGKALNSFVAADATFVLEKQDSKDFHSLNLDEIVLVSKTDYINLSDFVPSNRFEKIGNKVFFDFITIAILDEKFSKSLIISDSALQNYGLERFLWIKSKRTLNLQLLDQKVTLKPGCETVKNTDQVLAVCTSSGIHVAPNVLVDEVLENSQNLKDNGYLLINDSIIHSDFDLICRNKTDLIFGENCGDVSVEHTNSNAIFLRFEGQDLVKKTQSKVEYINHPSIMKKTPLLTIKKKIFINECKDGKSIGFDISPDCSFERHSKSFEFFPIGNKLMVLSSKEVIAICSNGVINLYSPLKNAHISDEPWKESCPKIDVTDHKVMEKNLNFTLIGVTFGVSMMIFFIFFAAFEFFRKRKKYNY